MKKKTSYKPLISRVNQFDGINPICNDTLQDKSKTEEDLTWEEFHGHHISDLTQQLKEQLKELGTGYTARMEKGLQIRYIGGDPGIPESDIMIIDSDPTHHKLEPASLPQPNPGGKFKILENPATDLAPDPARYDETKMFNAIGIYRSDGKPVAWIELLSPSNKRGGSYYAKYMDKRLSLLENRNMAFVEIDYLNQTSPTIHNFPDYTKQHPESTPYHITITDPRHLKRGEHLSTAKAITLAFGVDEPIPDIPIPLHGADWVDLNAQAAYNRTYRDFFYGLEIPVDYTFGRSIPHFKEYIEADQDRMLKRLLAVNIAYHERINLDEIKAPLPLDDKLLDPLIAQFKEQPQEFVLPHDPHAKGWDIDVNM